MQGPESKFETPSGADMSDQRRNLNSRERHFLEIIEETPFEIKEKV